MRVTRNCRKALAGRVGDKHAGPQTVQPQSRVSWGWAGNHPKSLEQQPKGEPVTYWRQHRGGWVLALGSGEPTVGDVGVAETPPQPGKHRL